ncbi:MAG TPA: hypothetical protein VM938_14475 [Acidimicrobiales bacterium]|nr:hypothetical protein [Acidimicrobiales bacterium]
MKRLLVIAALLLATSACGRSEARPSGVTERWLQAVSEQGRDGLREEGAKRADELAEPAATANVKPPDAEPDERMFSDLEVGKAAVDVDQARVPFRVTARIKGGERRERSAVAVLVKHDGDWRVVDVVPRIEGEAVPSEGGDRPARANATHWLIAFALSIVLTGGSIFLIDRQPTSTNSAPTG